MTDAESEPGRKEIFQRLVEYQDQGVAVVDSRDRVAHDFAISLEIVKDVEREGIAAQWPPL